METKSKTNFAKPLLILVGLLVIAGLSFYSGVSYEKSHDRHITTASTAATNSPFAGGFSGGNRFGSGNRVFGQVTVISPTSISVQNTSSNTTTTLTITSSTEINDGGQAVSYSDIQVGNTVFVSEDSSNTSDASRIVVNPSFGGANGGGSSSGSSNLPNTTTN